MTDRIFSFETWVRLDPSWSASGMVFFSGSSSTRYVLITCSSAGIPQCGYRDDADTVYSITSSGGSIKDNGWHHLCVTYSSIGPTMAFYVDGQDVGTATISSSTFPTPTTTRLGANSTPAAWFKGGIAAARAYNATLSAAEALAHYKLGPFGLGYKASDLILDLSAKNATATDSWIPAIDSTGDVIKGDQIMGNSITAGQIAVGAIGASEIAVNELAARSIKIGNFDNLMPNPMSEWSTTGRNTTQLDTNPDIDYRGVSASAKHTGNYGRVLSGAGSGIEASYVLTPLIPARPGEMYFLKCYGRLYSAGSGLSGELRIRPYDASGVMTSEIKSLVITSASWTELTFNDGGTPSHNYFTMPAGVTAFDVQYYTNTLSTSNWVYADEIFLRRMNEGDLIVDGAITALQIDADTITADNIAADLEMTAKYITGGVIRTANASERIELNEGTVDKLRFYTGISNEAANGYGQLYVSGVLNDYLSLNLISPTIGTKNGNLDMRTEYNGGTPFSRARLSAEDIVIGAGEYGDIFVPGSAGATTKLTGSVNYGPSFRANSRGSWEFMGQAAMYGDGSNLGEWYLSNLSAGGATATAAAANELHPGAVAFQTAAVANAGRRMTNGSTQIRLTTASGTRDYAEFVFQLNSSSANSHVRMGFCNWWTATGAGTGDYGAYLWTTGLTVDGRCAINGSVTATLTDTDDEGGLSADTWYTGRISVRNISGSDYVGFYIFEEGGDEPLWYDTVGDVPTGAALGHGFVFYTDDATARNVVTMDYMNYFLSPRER
jgi:hypothetical protein